MTRARMDLWFLTLWTSFGPEPLPADNGGTSASVVSSDACGMVIPPFVNRVLLAGVSGGGGSAIVEPKLGLKL